MSQVAKPALFVGQKIKIDDPFGGNGVSGQYHGKLAEIVNLWERGNFAGGWVKLPSGAQIPLMQVNMEPVQ